MAAVSASVVAKKVVTAVAAGLFKGDEENSTPQKIGVTIIVLLSIVIILCAVAQFIITSPLSLVLEKMGYSFIEQDIIETPKFEEALCPFPTEITSISNPYGAGTQFYSSHTGIDIPVGAESPVMAIRKGKVYDLGYDDDFGRYLVLEHSRPKPYLEWVTEGDPLYRPDIDLPQFKIVYRPFTFYTFYAHLRQIRSIRGQEVDVGSVVGTSGGDPKAENDYWIGNTTGAHLHFEIREEFPGYGNDVDPLLYLHQNIIEEELKELLKQAEGCFRVG